MHGAFEFISAARIRFGEGTVVQLPELVADAGGGKVLLVVGAHSAEQSGLLARLEELLDVGETINCTREPTIEDVDWGVQAARASGSQVVVAAGGGSVLDLGKAVAGLLGNGGELIDYLEGVGRGKALDKPAAPLIAVPTSAGTGSEVTKNAVISGEGFKKSIRSAHLIPKVALVDPELTYGLPPAETAACGMDALTQLIEPVLSTHANPLADALALEGIRRASVALLRAYRNPKDVEARRDMAFCSLLGGLCLANAGLGAVHGFASPLGAFFPIAHGVACAALLPQVMEANLQASRGTADEGRVWARFGQVAEALCGEPIPDREQAAELGLTFLKELQRDLQIPKLSLYGLQEAGARQKVVANARGSSMRYNPIELSDEQLDACLVAAL